MTVNSLCKSCIKKLQKVFFNKSCPRKGLRHLFRSFSIFPTAICLYHRLFSKSLNAVGSMTAQVQFNGVPVPIIACSWHPTPKCPFLAPPSRSWVVMGRYIKNIQISLRYRYIVQYRLEKMVYTKNFDISRYLIFTEFLKSTAAWVMLVKKCFLISWFYLLEVCKRKRGVYWKSK